MVNVFTHKRFIGNRNVIYEPEEFFKTRVAESVREGLYELSSEAKALIASEGVTRIEKDCVATKYGNMKLEDISWLSKMLIIMEFMHDMSYEDVLNITHNGQYLDEVWLRDNFLCRNSSADNTGEIVIELPSKDISTLPLSIPIAFTQFVGSDILYVFAFPPAVPPAFPAIILINRFSISITCL